jgi:hypothetical protein
MATFLNTQAISNELMRLIKDAKEKIILISYSFKVNQQIQERLKTKSKIGTLSEIVIVYGKTELKQTELEWIKEIQDLKIIEKLNLHAKCYLSEDRAIICSMNLYDYSQQTNIEMGILITKKDDETAYEALIDEINNIKINGTRKYLEDLIKIESEPKMITAATKKDIKESERKELIDPKALTLEQKLDAQLLYRWRYLKSKSEKSAESSILTDTEILKLVTQDFYSKNLLYDLLPKKIAIKFGENILEELANRKNLTIGKVVSIWYQTDDSKYDRVKLKNLKTGEERWFDTTQELPRKEKIVAVRLNNSWFNDYFYLD